MAPHGDDIELLHALAFFYWRRNQYERAAALAYAAYRLGKVDAKLLGLLALALLELGLPEQSLAILQEAAVGADEATMSSLHKIRARAHLRLGQLDLARAEFAAASKRIEQDAEQDNVTPPIR
jgi:tetratricopeptide (TPR) repeat protein